MLNIPEYKEYAGETKIALMDNSSLAFMHELSQRSYPSDGILSVYDLILIPKWVMEEIEDSTYRSTYVEQLQAQGYPIRWIDETKYGAFVNDEDVNLYYIVEAAVSRVSELMRFLRRKVKTEDLIDLPSAEEWMNRLYDEWPIHEHQYQVAVQKQEAAFKKIMLAVNDIEKAFSHGNPWLMKFRAISIPETLERTHLKEWLDHVWIVDFEQVEVILQESEWKRFFPEEWLNNGEEDCNGKKE